MIGKGGCLMSYTEVVFQLELVSTMPYANLSFSEMSYMCFGSIYIELKVVRVYKSALDEQGGFYIKSFNFVLFSGKQSILHDLGLEGIDKK